MLELAGRGKQVAKRRAETRWCPRVVLEFQLLGVLLELTLHLLHGVSEIRQLAGDALSTSSLSVIRCFHGTRGPSA